MSFFRLVIYNFLVFLLLIIFLEATLGYWFKKENFGIYMRKERKINWQTTSYFNGKEYKFFYKRNFWGFRGNEFNPKNVKIIFEGGSTGNQRFTPENLTIVGHLNKKFSDINQDFLIYNASTDGKSVTGYINDFKHWFTKIPELKPQYVIFYIGINDRFIDDNFYLDNKISESTIDQVKDYIKNNSIIVDKFKDFKNKYYPKNTLAYDLNKADLYDNFTYINFQEASKKHLEIDQTNKNLIKKFNLKLKKLNLIINSKKIQPIFITQAMFNGLEDKRLFLINNELKKFALENNYFLIPLDEMIVFNKDDFFDQIHTTPKGSKKIADIIYPQLYNYLKSKNAFNQ